MTYKLEYISTFHADISNLAENLHEYPAKAKRIIETLDKKLEALAQSPEMYQVYDDFPIFRRMPVEDYLVFYIVNERDRTVEVHRLIHGMMDISKQL